MHVIKFHGAITASIFLQTLFFLFELSFSYLRLKQYNSTGPLQ